MIKCRNTWQLWGVWFLNDLRWFDVKIGDQDTVPSYCHQGTCPIVYVCGLVTLWQYFWTSSSILQDIVIFVILNDVVDQGEWIWNHLLLKKTLRIPFLYTTVFRWHILWHGAVHQSINCVCNNSKNTFQNHFIFGHIVYWEISADPIENQHHSSINICIMAHEPFAAFSLGSYLSKLLRWALIYQS